MVGRLTPFIAASALGLLLVGIAGARPGAERHATIYSIRPDGSGRKLVLRLDPPAYQLVRSPGGKHIAFVSPDGGLYVADLSGEHAVRIDAPAGDPKFSPDGTRLATTSFSDCGWRCVHPKLYVVDTDGSGLRLVADGAQHASWSPDGTRLVYSGAWGIHVASASGSRDIVIAAGINPVWAPRGDRIAYLGSRRGYAVPCFVDADGSSRRCLRGFSAVNGIVWSQNGKRLPFMQATPPRLGVVGADGRGLRRFAKMGLRARPLAWSPDGHWLAYSKGLGEKEIYIRPVDGPGRERRVTDEFDQPYFGDVRWRNGRISYVVFEP